MCTDCRKYGKYWSNFGAGRMYVHSPARHVTVFNCVYTFEKDLGLDPA